MRQTFGEVRALVMSGKRPLILVTCDDGIESPGLRAAVRAVMDLGEVLVSAPCEQQTGAGRSLPTFDGVSVHEVEYVVDGQPIPAYAVHGTPAQTVLYTLVELVPRKPDLCVSGINFGENLGSGVSSSGTVGAALEAADGGVPALAVSLETDTKHHYNHSLEVDFSAAMPFTARFAAQMLAQSLPQDVDVLKVDIPRDAGPDTPWQVTRLSRQRYYRAVPSSRRYPGEQNAMGYRITVDHASLEVDSDVHAIRVDRVVSVTPLSLDLTSRVALRELETLLSS
jgi:5'-nucleotidase